MPKSKLSRRIAMLEERLGVRLIQRSTRRFVVTEAGQTYYMHCKAMLVEAEAAQEAIDTLKSEPRGVIRMTCPLPLLHAYVGVMLAEFMARYPHVMMHMDATNRLSIWSASPWTSPCVCDHRHWRIVIWPYAF